MQTRLVADIVAQRYDRALRDHATGRLLDLGCGQVPLFEAYRDRVDSVTCVDWGNSVHCSRHVDLECDLTKPLPFPDGSFDTIILSDVLEHLPEPQLCLSEISRLLSRGGKLLLNVPFYCGVHEEPHDYYRYTQYALKRFADNAGLEPLSIEPAGGAVECVFDLVGRVLSRFKPLSALVQSIAIRFWQTSRGQRIAERTGQKLPLGLFMIARKQ